MIKPERRIFTGIKEADYLIVETRTLLREGQLEPRHIQKRQLLVKRLIDEYSGLTVRLVDLAEELLKERDKEHGESAA